MLMIAKAKSFFSQLKSDQGSFGQGLIRLILYILAFSLPLVYLPVAGNQVAYGRILWFYLLVTLAALVWLIKLLIVNEINWQGRITDLTLFLFLLTYLFSSLFSVDRYQSFIGRGLVADFSFVTILFFILVYLLVSRYITGNNQIKTTLVSLIAATFLISFNFILNWLLPAVPVIFLAINISTFSLLILSGFFCCLILGLTKSRWSILLNLGSLYFLLYLFLLGNTNNLLILILGLFLVIVAFSIKSENFSEKLVIGITIILFVSVFAAVLPVSKLTQIIKIDELNLPINLGWEITNGSLGYNPLLGVGPQNFSYSFFKYKPLSYNQTSFWQAAFAKNSNFWLQILNNTGLLGLGFLILSVIIILYKTVLYLTRLKLLDEYVKDRYLLAAAIGINILIIIAHGFFYNFDFVSFFVMMLLLSLGAGLITINKEFTFENKSIIRTIVCILLLIVVCLGYYWLKFSLADIYAQKSLALNYDSGEKFSLGEDMLAKAIAANPGQADYYLKLANLELNKVFIVYNNQKTISDTTIFENIKKNLELAAKNQNLEPANLYQTDAIYIELKQMGLDIGDKRQIINEQLMTIDPLNPELYIDRALLNFETYTLIKSGELAVSDQTQQLQGLMVLIKSDLEKSLQLKSDYVLGFYNLGLFYQETGDDAQAFDNIKKAWEIDPGQKIIAKTLKKLYLNQDKATEASEVLIKYLEINPEDIEVRLELAKIYSDEGNLIKVKEEADKILALDPNNEQAKQLIK